MVRIAPSLALLAFIGPALGEDTKTYKVVDAADLGIGSRKYMGKDIEVRQTRCYYADVEDYRCLIGPLVVVFAKKIVPEEAQKRIEESCDTIKKAGQSTECVSSIRFNATEFVSDIVGGYQRRTIIKPDEIILPKAGAAERRRRDR
jgi:hypothetical protein